jgi:hypothetical protein
LQIKIKDLKEKLKTLEQQKEQLDNQLINAKKGKEESVKSFTKILILKITNRNKEPKISSVLLSSRKRTQRRKSRLTSTSAMTQNEKLN